MKALPFSYHTPLELRTSYSSCLYCAHKAPGDIPGKAQRHARCAGRYDDDYLTRPSRTQPIGVPAEGIGGAAAATLDPSFGDPGYRRPLMPLAAKDWRGQHMVLGVRIKAKLASQA